MLTPTFVGSEILLVVYAPLEGLRGAEPQALSASAAARMVEHLREVARGGVHVAALIDPGDGPTRAVHIAAGAAAQSHVEARAKLAMNDADTLTRWLVAAHAVHPAAAIVLAIEGTGGGFVPEVGAAAGPQHWAVDDGVSVPVHGDGSTIDLVGAPVGVGPGPAVATDKLPMATTVLGRALADAAAQGVPRLAVLLLNASFCMSVEVLHTVMPYTEWAVGYPNHNFFCAAATFPIALAGLATGTTAENIAQRLAHANHALLGGDGRHPTVGCAVRLARMREIVERIDDLADALLAALRAPSTRAAAIAAIRSSMASTQQYDTEARFELSSPDPVVDLAGFCGALRRYRFEPVPVPALAQELHDLLRGVTVYADDGLPWCAPTERWNFSSGEHAMNIFLPDPLLDGVWDWRAPRYLDAANAPPTGFQKATDWIAFIVEYHRETRFRGLLPVALPPMLHHVGVTET